MDLIQAYPDISEVIWEATQGGEFLAENTLGSDFPRPVTYNYPKMSKLERAEILLTRYRRHQVVHSKKLPSYEAEALMLPMMPHSPNMVDAVSQAVDHLSKAQRPGTKPSPAVRVVQR